MYITYIPALSDTEAGIQQLQSLKSHQKMAGTIEMQTLITPCILFKTTLELFSACQGDGSRGPRSSLFLTVDGFPVTGGGSGPFSLFLRASRCLDSILLPHLLRPC